MRQHSLWPKLPTLGLLALLVVAFGLRYAVWQRVVSDDPRRLLRPPDSDSYLDSAQALWLTGRFARSPSRWAEPETFRTPGYPAFLAVFFALRGRADYQPIIVVQGLLSVVTVGLVFWIGARLWTTSAALLASLLLAFDLPSFTAALVVMSETLFTLLLTVVLVLLVQLSAGQERSKPWLALGSGVTLALATLVRPVSYYLIVVLVIGVGWIGWQQPWARRTLVVSLGLMVIAYTLLIGSWQVRNWLVTGDAAFSQVTANNLLFYRAAGVIALRDQISLEQAQEQLRAAVVVRDGKVDLASMAQTGVAILRQYPVLTLRMTFAGLFTLLLGFGDGIFARIWYAIPDVSSPSTDLLRLPMGQALVKWWTNWPLALAAFGLSALQMFLVYGGILLWWGQRLWSSRWVPQKHGWLLGIAPLDWLLWGIVSYFLVISAGAEANSRFRTPIMPLLVLFAAAGYWEWHTRNRSST